MNYKIAVCDDDAAQRVYLAGIVAQWAKRRRCLAEVRQYPEGGAFLFAYGEEKDFDILLLDIDMPDMSGLEVAERLGEGERKPLLVFVTSYDELVYDSLRYHPFAFVRKKYLAHELTLVLADCGKELAAKEKRFHFRAEGGKLALRLADIRYFEAEGNYLIVYSTSGDYRCRSTMTMVENALASDGFIRIHKGFLVNQAHIKILRQEELELLSGELLPIGKCYAKDAKKRILHYMRE